MSPNTEAEMVAGEGWPVKYLDIKSSAAKTHLLPQVEPPWPGLPPHQVTHTNQGVPLLVDPYSWPPHDVPLAPQVRQQQGRRTTRLQAWAGQRLPCPDATPALPLPCPWSPPPLPFWVRTSTGREQPLH